MLNPWISVIPAFMILVAGISPLSAEEEDEQEENNGLFIVTTTDKISAQLARCLQEGPSSPDDNMNPETDKKRKQIGIGEDVELRLDGKRKGDDEKVIWSYVGDADKYVKLPNSPEGNPVRMTVKQNFDEDQSATIKATSENGESREVSFSLRVPSRLRGTHKKSVPLDPGNNQAGVVPELKDETGRITNPQPGETGTIGASADLDVTVDPVEVSFRDIVIIERANDPPGTKPTHIPNPQSMKLNDFNQFTDCIAATSSASPSGPLPAGWTWKCAYMVVKNNQDTIKMTREDIIQTASFIRTGGAADPGVETTVNKFGCSVSRDSRTGEHQFTPSTCQP